MLAENLVDTFRPLQLNGSQEHRSCVANEASENVRSAPMEVDGGKHRTVHQFCLVFPF